MIAGDIWLGLYSIHIFSKYINDIEPKVIRILDMEKKEIDFFG